MRPLLTYKSLICPPPLTHTLHLTLIIFFLIRESMIAALKHYEDQVLVKNMEIQYLNKVHNKRAKLNIPIHDVP